MVGRGRGGRCRSRNGGRRGGPSGRPGSFALGRSGGGRQSGRLLSHRAGPGRGRRGDVVGSRCGSRRQARRVVRSPAGRQVRGCIDDRRRVRLHTRRGSGTAGRGGQRFPGARRLSGRDRTALFRWVGWLGLEVWMKGQRGGAARRTRWQRRVRVRVRPDAAGERAVSPGSIPGTAGHQDYQSEQGKGAAHVRVRAGGAGRPGTNHPNHTRADGAGQAEGVAGVGPGRRPGACSRQMR